MEKIRYAFFDFDGTLISKDSFLIILKKIISNEPYRLFLLLLWTPFLLATAIFRLDKTFAKSVILWSLTVGKDKKLCAQFLRNILATESNSLLFTEVIPTFQQLKSQGIEIVIVTASGQTWVRGMLHGKVQNIRLIIGSELTYFAGGVILKSKNCYQAEKIKRIEKILGTNIEWHSGWSDHIADLPMLSLAKERHIICPKKKHLKIFEKNLNGNFKLHNWKAKENI
ncbi:HAD-IB family phosphatase [Pigmentibacter sp. JX0631]|uniref:HAD-IB family phosphatase n=1 Tax=Pigmentibacter sp. JX0631 TaxID=2976982 RepID=UPI002469A64D|nr:HAD-IB family phosphatase [Pigmentibacter sp. JX0631]WGL60008.1 HAD-IB family phosphatase [Pigmentibacter sp. JX0631]